MPQSLTGTNPPRPASAGRRRIRIFQATLALLILVFLGLAVLAKTAAYFSFDVAITRGIQAVHNDGFAGLMAAVSWVGFTPQVYAILLGLVGLLALGGLKRESLVLAGSVIGIAILGTLIKVLIGRPRPGIDLVNVVAPLTSYSFPSGHVLFFTTCFGFLLFLTWVRLAPSWERTVAVLALAALMGLVGISRIYVGQHWASDVLAAYLLGFVWLSATIAVYRRAQRRALAE